MANDVNEFSFIIKVDEIGAGASRHQISANEDQRAALRTRFDVLALDSLSAEFELERKGLVVTATGQLSADVVQACIASGAPVAALLSEPFDIRFMTQAAMETDSEVELAAEDCDTVLYDGKAIDIGEAVAQSLGIALDPYPRSVDAAKILRDAGVKSEEEAGAEAGPFAALAALKSKLPRQ
jgi:uncharacterized metal-binding protein YceD (DUF177 family)